MTQFSIPLHGAPLPAPPPSFLDWDPFPDTATRFEEIFGLEAARAWGFRYPPATTSSFRAALKEVMSAQRLKNQFYAESAFLSSLSKRYETPGWRQTPDHRFSTRAKRRVRRVWRWITE